MPPQGKDTVKEKLPIEEVVGTYEKLTRAGKNLRAPCPFHKERTPSFYVSPERGTYYCFGCGEKGDIFSFVQKQEGVDFKEALVMLADRAGVTLPACTGETGPSKSEKDRLFEVQEEATAVFEKELETRKDVGKYLRVRGLTGETISSWRLGYAAPQWRSLTDHLRTKGFTDRELIDSGLCIEASKEGKKTIYDRFRGRIMFPIGASDGRIIGFSGRYFEKMPGMISKDGKDDEPAKYVNSPETPLFHKSHVLYGFDRAKAHMRRSNFAILVEGQMDLLMMHQSGLHTALASSGTAFTPEHLRLIGNITKRLVLALDGDAAGVRSALKSALLAYTAGFDLKVAAFPKGKDPADVGKDNPEELKRSVREAKTAIEFFLSHLRDESKDERGFRRATEETVLPLIAAMQSNIDQAHFIEVVASAIGLPQESVRAELARIVAAKKKGVATVQTPSGAAQVEPLPKMLHIVGLIEVSHDEEAKEKAKTIVGEERMQEMHEQVEKEKDRILFLSEQQEGMVHNMKDLLIELEKEYLREQIEEERSQGSASSKLQELKRKLDSFDSK